ncbi:hypothetical protein GCM10027280_02710 [Micromonospora polyrhachis]
MRERSGPSILRSRRSVLRVAGLLTLAAATGPLAACGLFDDSEPEPDPLAPLLAGALDLAALYEAAVAADPTLADRLTPIAQAHRAHAEELARVTRVTLPNSTPTAGPTLPTGDRKSMLTALRSAEQQGQAAATTACLSTPAHRAALVGSIAAARATHLELL